MLHNVALMVEIRSEFERVRGLKGLGQSRSAWYIFRQKAVWPWVTSSRQKTVTAELKSRGIMYRKELVSKTGTRLS